jgi:hypothetical protein
MKIMRKMIYLLMPGSESAVLKREERTKRKRAIETIGMARLTLSDKYGKLKRRG